MELKFKTIFDNQLIDCQISTHENLVFKKHGDFWGAIGRIDNKNLIKDGFPILPVLLVAGRDKNGNDIVAGHVVKTGLMQLEAVVVWFAKMSGFYLDFGDQGIKDHLQPLGSELCEPHNCEIIRHINIVKKLNGVTA